MSVVRGQAPAKPQISSKRSAAPALLEKNAVPRPEDRRGQLLEIAGRMFAEVGFEATTIRMIAMEAGMLSGSLYHHFGTKEEMLHKILENGVRDMKLSTGRLAQAAADPETRLIALILLYMNELFDDQDAFALLYNDRRFLRRHPDFTYVTEAKKVMFLNWCSVLAEGRTEGLFRADLEEFLIVTTIIRMLSTSADWFIHQGDYSYDGIIPSDRSQLIDFNIDIILRMVRVPERVTEPFFREAAEKLITAL